MKKLAISAKSILSLAIILGAAATSCNSSDNAGAAATDARPAASAANSGAAAGINIRYIDADSISAHYKLAQEFQQQTLATVSKIENVRQARAGEIQKMGQSIEQKQRNNGYLSQESFEGDVASFNKKQQDAAATLDNMQARAQQEMAQRQIELNDSLESFIKRYNKQKGYSAILYKAAGVYFDPALDITDEVIEGLNAAYEKGKKDK